MMGGHQIPGIGSGDDGYDEEGYDESQRAEILEATRDGPTDGIVLTDLIPDLGEDPEDDLEMTADEVGEEDEDAAEDETAVAEDEVQGDFDAGTLGDDDDLDDADDAALRP
jgi:DNA-directed RNA polymerase subunit delta